MASQIPDRRPLCSTGFQRAPTCFLSRPGLPFTNLLSAKHIERIFAKYDALWGMCRVYSTAVMLWTFLGQVPRDGKEAACQLAVPGVVSYYLLARQRGRIFGLFWSVSRWKNGFVTEH